MDLEIGCYGLNSDAVNKEISNIQLGIIKLEQSKFSGLDIRNKEGKIIRLKDIIEHNINNINNNDNNIIKELQYISKSEYGFIYMKYRRIFYKYIINTLFNKEHNELKNIDYINDSTYSDIIEKDSIRSIIFSIINNSDLEDIDKSINKDIFIKILKKYTNIIVNNIHNFQYYQGYHEIALYLLLLFGFNKESVILAIKFTILFFDYFISEDIDYPFLLDLLSNCAEEINKQSNTSLIKITQTKPYFSLSWAITWFTHDNKNIISNYRIIDYLILSNISSVYILSSSLIIHEFNILKQINNNIDKDDIYMEEIFTHYQNIDYNKINWDNLINNISTNEIEYKYNQALYKTINQITTKHSPNIYNPLKKKHYKSESTKIYKKMSIYIMIIMIIIVIIKKIK